MSLSYEYEVRINGANPDRLDDIVKVMNERWGFEDVFAGPHDDEDDEEDIDDFEDDDDDDDDYDGEDDDEDDEEAQLLFIADRWFEHEVVFNAASASIAKSVWQANQGFCNVNVTHARVERTITLACGFHEEAYRTYLAWSDAESKAQTTPPAA